MASLNSSVVHGSLAVTNEIHGKLDGSIVGSAVTNLNSAIPALLNKDTYVVTEYFVAGSSATNRPADGYNWHIQSMLYKLNSTAYRVTQIATASGSGGGSLMYERSGYSSDGSAWTFTGWKSTINTDGDTKVKITAKTDNVAYPLLAAASASPTSGSASEAVYDTGVTLNPSTNTIAANISGNSATATKAYTVEADKDHYLWNNSGYTGTGADQAAILGTVEFNTTTLGSGDSAYEGCWSNIHDNYLFTSRHSGSGILGIYICMPGSVTGQNPAALISCYGPEYGSACGCPFRLRCKKTKDSSTGHWKYVCTVYAACADYNYTTIHGRVSRHSDAGLTLKTSSNIVTEASITDDAYGTLVTSCEFNHAVTATKASSSDKAVALVDYGDTSKTIKVGYSSATLTSATYLAAYGEVNGQRVIKDINVANVTVGTASKVSSTLTFGSKTYNGSEAKEITAADLGAITTVAPLKLNTSDMPAGSANLSATTTKHTIAVYQNGLSIPYQGENSNDGGILRVKGSDENSTILELGTWDDYGTGETIQFNYYPTTSQVTPTYSVSVPKKTGTIALTSDLDSYLPLSGGTMTGTLTTSTLVVNTNTDTTPLKITRGGTDGECVSHMVNDSTYTIKYTNDETANFVRLWFNNTDTEAPHSPSQASSSSLYFNSSRQFYPDTTNTGSIGTSDKKWANMYATTFNGNLSGNATTANALVCARNSMPDGTALTDLNNFYIKGRTLFVEVNSKKSDGTGGPVSNCPIADGNWYLVESRCGNDNSAVYCSQIATRMTGVAYTSTDAVKIWIRTCIVNNWSAWVDVSGSARTAADLGISATTTSVTVGPTTFNQYTHPTSAGNKHVPSGGSTGQILGYDSAGNAKWIDGMTYSYFPGAYGTFRSWPWTAPTDSSGNKIQAYCLLMKLESGSLGASTHSGITLRLLCEYREAKWNVLLYYYSDARTSSPVLNVKVESTTDYTTDVLKYFTFTISDTTDGQVIRVYAKIVTGGYSRYTVTQLQSMTGDQYSYSVNAVATGYRTNANSYTAGGNIVTTYQGIAASYVSSRNVGSVNSDGLINIHCKDSNTSSESKLAIYKSTSSAWATSTDNIQLYYDGKGNRGLWDSVNNKNILYIPSDKKWVNIPLELDIQNELYINSTDKSHILVKNTSSTGFSSVVVLKPGESDWTISGDDASKYTKHMAFEFNSNGMRGIYDSQVDGWILSVDTSNKAVFNGTASMIAIHPEDNEKNKNYYITYVNSDGATATGNEYWLRCDSDSLKYNPSTNTLTVANITGTASNATKWGGHSVAVSTSIDENATIYFI